VGRFSGKVALITGAGKGIGRGVARRFAAEGAAVAIAEIDPDAGQDTAAAVTGLGGRGLFLHADVSDKGQAQGAVAAALSEFGRLDVLVNNAYGPSPNVVLEQKTDDMLERVLRTGLWATWWTMHAAFPAMRDQGGGRIVNFYSIDAEAAAWLHADYNLTKDAIRGLTRSAAVEWARFNILVNAVAPAAAGTVFHELSASIPGFAEAAAAANPLGRVGDPEQDIAPVVLFLASDDARYITGETIHVDGGQHLPRYQSKPASLPDAAWREGQQDDG
jgi:NAD(P)-dependent dehydrogenase (short-subunit alcohol dehydrogenase family)